MADRSFGFGGRVILAEVAGHAIGDAGSAPIVVDARRALGPAH